MRSIRWLSPGLGASEPGPAPRPGESAFKLRDLWQAGALLGVFLAGLVAATLYPSGRDGQYLVVAPPWYGMNQTLALVQAVDGRVVDGGGPANMAIIHSTRPDFVRTLYGAGAWLVLDPMQLRGCAGFRPADTEGRT